MPAIKGGRGAGKADKTKQVSIGKRGSIIISKELVESMGIGAGDKFTLRKAKAGIALKKAEKPVHARHAALSSRRALKNS